MFDKSTVILLANQAGLRKPPRMLPDRLFVRAKLLSYFFQGDALTCRNQKQYINPMMIGQTFEMPFHLFGCFHCFHICIITLHTNILQYVRMMFKDEKKCNDEVNVECVWREGYQFSLKRYLFALSEGGQVPLERVLFLLLTLLLMIFQ